MTTTRGVKNVAPQGVRKNETLMQLHQRMLQSFKKFSVNALDGACFPPRAIATADSSIIRTVVWCGGMGTVEAASMFVPEISVVGNVEKSIAANKVQNLLAGDGIPNGEDIYFYTNTENVYPFHLLKAKLLIISAPCQDFSSRNAVKDGLDGVDGDVLKACLTALRLAIEAGTGPELVIIENVPGICHKSVKSGKPAPIVHVMDEFYSMGFECVCSRALDSVFCGVPMHREREFIVASFNGTISLDILYNEKVIKGCLGGCKVGDRWCFEHFKAQQASKNSSADSPYVGYMHCAQTPMVHDVLSHLTASSGDIAMVGAMGSYAGALKDEHITSLMGLPFDLLSGVKARSSKITLLGNGIQVNVLIWLLNRVAVCNNAENYKKTTIKRFLNKHGKCIDDVVARFHGTSWIDGTKLGPEIKFKPSDTMPLNAISIRNFGTFEVVDVADHPPGPLFTPIEDTVPPAELKCLKHHQWYGWLYRLTRNGVVLDADLLSRLALWAGPSAHLIVPPICQRGLADKDLFFETGFVYVESLKLWLGAELMKSDNRNLLGRGVPSGPPLQKGQYYAMISPVNYSGTSKTANLLALPTKFSGWFLVNEGLDCHLSRTPAAAKVSNASRVSAIQAIERGNPESRLIFSLLDDATVWINDIEAARRRLPGASMSQTLRHLRMLAVKAVSKLKNLSDLCRNTRAAVYMGSTGAYLTHLGKETIGYKIKLHWNGNMISGVVVDFVAPGLKTCIRLDGSNKIQQYHLAGHQCLVESFVEIKKRSAVTVISAQRQKQHQRKISNNKSTKGTLTTLSAVQRKEDTLLLPRLDYSNRKTSMGAVIKAGDSVDVSLISGTRLAALERMCLQDYVNYGELSVGNGQSTSNMLSLVAPVILWQSLGVNKRPTSFYKMIGLFRSTKNWGLGDILDVFFGDLYSCAAGVFRHLVENSRHGTEIKLNLSFAAPDGSSETIKKIMPTLSCGSASRLVPRFAEIGVFDQLELAMKKEVRFELLCLICRAGGALPAKALPGANALVTFWRNGVKVNTEMEIPQYSTKFVKL